jgi:hypothetical protein
MAQGGRAHPRGGHARLVAGRARVSKPARTEKLAAPTATAFLPVRYSAPGAQAALRSALRLRRRVPIGKPCPFRRGGRIDNRAPLSLPRDARYRRSGRRAAASRPSGEGRCREPALDCQTPPGYAERPTRRSPAVTTTRSTQLSEPCGEPAVSSPMRAAVRRLPGAPCGPACASSGRCSRPARPGETPGAVAKESSGRAARDDSFGGGVGI